MQQLINEHGIVAFGSVCLFISFFIQGIFFRIYLKYIREFAYVKDDLNQYSLAKNFPIVSFITRIAGAGIIFGGIIGAIIWGITVFISTIFTNGLNNSLTTFIVDYHYIIWLPSMMIFNTYFTIYHLLNRQIDYRNHKEGYDSGKRKHEL